MNLLHRLRMRSPLLGFWGWNPGPLGARSEISTATRLIIFKLVLAIAAAISAFQMRSSWKWVHAHPETTTTTRHNIDLSMHLGWLTLMILWPWTLASGIVLFSSKLKGPDPRFLIIGTVDLGLSVAFAVALGLQDEWLPTRSKGCSQIANFQTPNNAIPPTPNFFTLASIGEDRLRKDPKAVCEKLVSNWQTGVAVGFFAMLVAYIGVFFDTRPRSVLHPHRPLVALGILIFGPIAGAFQVLRTFVVPRALFWLRIARKAVRCWTGQGYETAPLQGKIRDWRYPWKTAETRELELELRTVFQDPQPYKIQNPGLHGILTIEHILLGIASEACYDDMLSLSRTCRHVREAVFPSQDMRWRTWKLRTHCCTVADRGCIILDESDNDTDNLDTQVAATTPLPWSAFFSSLNLPQPAASTSAAAAAGAAAAATHPANIGAYMTTTTTTTSNTSGPSQPQPSSPPQSQPPGPTKPELPNFNTPLKHPCPYCRNPICPTCTRTPLLPPIPESFHARRCVPICTSCYYKFFCALRRIPPPGAAPGAAPQRYPLRRKGVCGKEGPCAGRQDRDSAAIWKIGTKSWRARGRADKGSDKDRDMGRAEPVCRGCERRFVELRVDIQEGRRREIRREMREDAELGFKSHISKTSGRRRDGQDEYWKSPRVEEEGGMEECGRAGAKCGKCKVALGMGLFGVRFWVCRICGGECRDKCHVPWARRRKIGREAL